MIVFIGTESENKLFVKTNKKIVVEKDKNYYETYALYSEGYYREK